MRTYYFVLGLTFFYHCHGAMAVNDIEPGKEFYTAVRAENPIVLDGDLSEWPGTNVVTNPKFYIPKFTGNNPFAGGELVYFETFRDGDWTGFDDHSSEIQIVYNDDYVYLGVVVTDEYHENAAHSAWNGDSIQLMIADAERETQVALYNYALGGVENALGEIIIQHEARPGNSADTEAIVLRDSDAKRTTYEVCLPKEALALDELSRGVQFGMSILTNDGDEFSPGETGWGELGPQAIVFGRSAQETALITLGPVPVALNIRPARDPVDENTSVQMLGQAVFSDGTLAALTGSELSWHQIEGPIATIDGDGNTILMEVDDDTRATVVGSYRNVRSSVSFTASDVRASLSLSDQSVDSDRDGQSDTLEKLTGYDENDATDFFGYRLENDIDGTILELSQVIPGTQYIIESSTDARIYRKVATISPHQVETHFRFRSRLPLERKKLYRIRLTPANIAQ